MAEKHKEQMETWKKEHEEQMKQWAKEGPFGNLRGEDENVGTWDNLVEELKEKPMEEHEKWQKDAWTLLEEWLKDDSPSSSLNLEGWKSEVPMIHLSSRVTKGNSTEEKMGKVPVSTLVLLLRHLATSPLFLQTVPMLLPIIVPAALLFLLGPLLVVPIIMLVVGGTIMAGLSFFGSLLFPLGMGAVTHMVSWLSRQVTIILDLQNCPLMRTTAGHAQPARKIGRGKGVHRVREQHSGLDPQVNRLPPNGVGRDCQHKHGGAQRGAQASLLVNNEHQCYLSSWDALSPWAFKRRPFSSVAIVYVAFWSHCRYEVFNRVKI